MSHIWPVLADLCAFVIVPLFLLAIAAIAIIQFNDGYLKLAAWLIDRELARNQSSIQELEDLFALPDPRGAWNRR